MSKVRAVNNLVYIKRVKVNSTSTAIKNFEILNPYQQLSESQRGVILDMGTLAFRYETPERKPKIGDTIIFKGDVGVIHHPDASTTENLIIVDTYVMGVIEDE